jgi:hypothetical protein
MLNSNDEKLVPKTQEIHEEQIVASFDFPKRLGSPQIGALILLQLGFGVVIIININRNETQTNDIVVELIHNGFWIEA